MAKYKYMGNKSPANSSNEIVLEVDGAGNPKRSLYLNGEPGELTYTQYLQLKDLFILTEVEDKAVPAVSDSLNMVKSLEQTVVTQSDKA